MGLRRDHQHISDDIMQVDAVHTPISPTGLQEVSRIGPFHVAFDTPGFANPGGAPLDLGVSLPTGTMILRALVFVTETFTSPGTDGKEYIEVTVGIGANLIGQWAAAGGVDANINIEALTRYVADNPQFLPFAISRAAFATEDDTPMQAACWSNDTLNAGQADIYAIIATPAV